MRSSRCQSRPVQRSRRSGRSLQSPAPPAPYLPAHWSPAPQAPAAGLTCGCSAKMACRRWKKLLCCSWRAPVDADRQLKPDGLPLLDLRQCGINHPFAYHHRQRVVFNHRQKSSRCQRAFFGMLPADQCLGTRHLAAMHVDFGLVVQHNYRNPAPDGYAPGFRDGHARCCPVQHQTRSNGFCPSPWPGT